MEQDSYRPKKGFPKYTFLVLSVSFCQLGNADVGNYVSNVTNESSYKVDFFF